MREKLWLMATKTCGECGGCGMVPHPEKDEIECWACNGRGEIETKISVGELKQLLAAHKPDASKFGEEK